MYWTIQKSLLLKYETLIIWETWFLLLLFNHSIMSDFLRPQYAKLPCPSPFPRQCSNSCPESIQNFILSHPLLLLPSILPSIRVFSNESALFASGGQGIGASAAASVLPMNIQDRFLLKWTGLISLQSKGLSRVFSDYLSIVNLQRCVSFRGRAKWVSYTYTCIHYFWDSFPSTPLQSTE